MWRTRVAKHSKGSHTGEAGTYPRRAPNRSASTSRSSAIRSLASQITVLPARSAKSRYHEASSRSFSSYRCWRVLTSCVRDDLRRDRMAAQTLTIAGSRKSSTICLMCRETFLSFPWDPPEFANVSCSPSCIGDQWLPRLGDEREQGNFASRR
jgi:hypothetical protein